MHYRRLGKTGLDVSVLAFGAGPVPALMTAGDDAARCAVVRRALDRGINWFDTAAGYGNGLSERNLGAALAQLDARDAVHLATKVRLAGDDLLDVERAIRVSLAASCERLGASRVTLLQLHNALTPRRDDEPASLSPDDVLGPCGVLAAFQRLRDEGRIDWFGLTGTGHSEALRAVVASGEFHTVQTPYNLVNPSAGQPMDTSFSESNYGNLFAECQRHEMGVFAIRVFAGGALAGQPPSGHTFQTKFFPLDLYRRDERRAEQWRLRLEPRGVGVKEAAVRFALSHPAVTAAIIGFNDPAQIDEAVTFADRGPIKIDC